MVGFHLKSKRRVANDEKSAVTSTSFARQTSQLIPATIQVLSVCHNVQSSVDAAAAHEGGLPDPMKRTTGVCTAALLEVLYHASSSQRKNANWSWQDVLWALRERLQEQGHEQMPQLTSSCPLDVRKTPFSLGSSGRKRALLVAINYVGQEGALQGCHNDAYGIRHYLTTVHGYAPCDVTLLADDGKHIPPTRHEIMRALQALIQSSKAGDAVYFHFIGHGGLLFPEANDFKAKYKGYDETLYPVDHAYAGQILDQSLYRRLVAPIMAGVSVTAVLDFCHCGSVLELPYCYQATSGTQVQSRENLDALANVAFLQVLMGNLLPASGFENIVSHIEATTGNSIREYQGVGLALEDQQGSLGVDNSTEKNQKAPVGESGSNECGRDHPETSDTSKDSSGADCDCLGGGILSFLVGFLAVCTAFVFSDVSLGSDR